MRTFSQFRCTVRFRYVSHGGDLGKREAAKELQIDDLGQGGLHFAQLVERFADADKFSVIHRVLHRFRVERRDLQ
jgi:hypothetical protein